MTYEEAKAYIEEVSRTGSILGLENIVNLMQELKNVQEELKIIHIAGTNGKGSTGAFIEAILLEAGYKVGRYTSPAVFEPFEVWRINRENISMEDYLACLSEVRAACERMIKKRMAQPTVFEVETALAFVYFARQHCDYVLLEVGMGGETDATNLITKPICSVITSISRDHMQFLGNSLAEIAHVKAGIIKKGCPIVTVDTQKEEVLAVIRQVAEEKQAELFMACGVDMISKETKAEDATELCSQAESSESRVKEAKITLHYKHEELGDIELSLVGTYQIENANLAIAVTDKVLGLDRDVIIRGLKKAYWPGRFEIIRRNPIVVLDGAHNEDAAYKLKKTLQNHFTNRKITYIIGVLADKEHKKMLEIMLPLAERVYTVTPLNPRALHGEALAKEVESLHREAVYCSDFDMAAEAVYTSAAEDEVIVAFGSLSYLAGMKTALERKAAEMRE